MGNYEFNIGIDEYKRIIKKFLYDTPEWVVAIGDNSVSVEEIDDILNAGGIVDVDTVDYGVVEFSLEDLKCGVDIWVSSYYRPNMILSEVIDEADDIIQISMFGEVVY